MTRLTRRFVLGGASILAVGLCVGLAAYFGGLPTGAFVDDPGPAELTYVPPEAAVVAYADVRHVMASDLRQRLRAVAPREEQGQEEFRARTGIDIENDIDYVVACVMPRDGRESGFVALRGRFDDVRLEALAREHEGVVEEYRGKRLIRLPERHDPAREGSAGIAAAVAFVEPGLIFVGDATAIHQALDTSAEGRSVVANDEVMQLIKGLDSGADAWAVGRFDVLASRAGLSPDIAGQMPAVTWFSAAGRINGGMSGVVRAEARDEQAAQNLRDVVHGFVALARLQSGNRPELERALQSVTLGGVGKTVELSFALPEDLIDLLPRLAQPHPDPGGQ
jgi:hypothetical protein